MSRTPTDRSILDRALKVIREDPSARRARGFLSIDDIPAVADSLVDEAFIAEIGDILAANERDDTTE